MKPENCKKIYDYLLENSEMDNSISSISDSLNISKSEVEECITTMASYFVKKKDSDYYAVNQEESKNRDAFLQELHKTSANKVSGVFWFLILFTIGMSLFTIFISKGN